MCAKSSHISLTFWMQMMGKNYIWKYWRYNCSPFNLNLKLNSLFDVLQHFGRKMDAFSSINWKSIKTLFMPYVAKAEFRYFGWDYETACGYWQRERSKKKLGYRSYGGNELLILLIKTAPPHTFTRTAHRLKHSVRIQIAWVAS